jgi:hypothetical protein
MDLNHRPDQRTALRGVPGVVMSWHGFGGCASRCGKRSHIAALNLLPRVVAGI